MNDPHPFAETSVSEQVMAALGAAQRLRFMASIQGPPGIGKTTSIREYERTASAPVWVFTASRATGAMGPLMRALAREFAGTADVRPAENFRALTIAVNWSAGIDHSVLLIIDEAQHLNPEALEQLRALFDQKDDPAADCKGLGLAFVGNHSFVDRFNGERRNVATSEQFRSRIAIKLDLAPVSHSDVDLVARSRGINDRVLINRLALIANGNRGLRAVAGVCDLAADLAGTSPPSADHFRSALTVLGHG